ncbi:FAD/NAD-binding domain-containing protein [Phellopilus nigrolimitatus]|nr:FAD/NAD-binding domain-containing protein [Phellopilus nigrolimitatus]
MRGPESLPSTAGVALQFIVVGGSIAGLSCAYNLRQAGHRVRVLERTSNTKHGLGGLRVPPNLTKLLFHWGLKEKVDKLGVKCPRIDFQEGYTGEYLSSLVFHEAIMKELQADSYGMHYDDLRDMIFDIAVKSGARVDFNTEVVDVNIHEPSVLLASGERLYADIIVGADGAQSLVREYMTGGETHEVGPCTGFSYSVPVKEMMKDPELRPIIEKDKGAWRVWTGGRRAILSYRIRPDEYGIHLLYPDPKATSAWEKTVNLQPIFKQFEKFETACQRLIKLRSTALEIKHVVQKPLEDWFSDDGRVVLIGDAVHALVPGTTHGASLAIEDGAVLGSLFSRLKSHDGSEIVRLLSAFQEIRQDRCSVIAKSELESVLLVSLPDDDPMRAVRDAGFRAGRDAHALDWDDIGEDSLSSAWEDFKMSFGYEAYDAADDWWVDWGVMRERMAASIRRDEARDGRAPTSGGLSLPQGLTTTARGTPR